MDRVELEHGHREVGQEQGEGCHDHAGHGHGEARHNDGEGSHDHDHGHGGHEHGHEHEHGEGGKGRVFCFGAGGVLLGLALLTGSELLDFGLSEQSLAGLSLGLYLAAYLAAGGSVLWQALKNIAHGQVFDENFLMSLATIGAFCIGKYPEGVAVMLFYQIGEWFQDMAVDQTRRSITALMDIRPDQAAVRREGRILPMDAKEVQVGELIVVKAGEKLPLDGVVAEGTSSLDTSALTGESLPAAVAPGMPALSGCINLSGLLVIEVTKEYSQSTVAKILELVEEAADRKSNSERFITRFARYYTPGVVGAAVLLAVLPPLLVPGAVFSDWLYRALVFLVISCPCALVISIPLGFFAGMGAASKKGILVKGGNYLEALARTETVVFDKTGTLTKGVFRVQELWPAEEGGEAELLELAAWAEASSNHPISLSLKEAYGKEIPLEQIQEAKELTGLGVQAAFGGKDVLVGNERLLRSRNVVFSLQEGAADAGTVVYVAADGVYKGCIAIADQVKEDAAAAVQGLRQVGVKQLVMLTGDGERAGKKVAAALGLDQVYTGLLPADKVARLEALMAESRQLGAAGQPGNAAGEDRSAGTEEEGPVGSAQKAAWGESPARRRNLGKVAFVGDGVNDAPVLARADVGVAMGGLGSDAAIEAADVVLMTDEPSRMVIAISLARRTMGVAKQNIVMALGIKALVLLLGALGLASLWWAVFADVGVALLAIINALRILK